MEIVVHVIAGYISLGLDAVAILMVAVGAIIALIEMLLAFIRGQASCTAGRAAFITGQLPMRTSLTTVGLPGTPQGLQPEDPTQAELLKPLGYMTARFGKNHLGGEVRVLFSSIAPRHQQPVKVNFVLPK